MRGANTSVCVRGFAGPGDVGQHAGGTVEVPLAGLTQRFFDVDDEVAVVGCKVRPPGQAGRGAGEVDDLLIGVDRGDAHARGGPLVKRDEFDIGEVRPVGLEVGFFELETVEAALGVGFGGGHIRGDVEVTGSGDARPRAALVTHEELSEVPLAVLHRVEGQSPAAVVADLPAGELDAGAEDGAFICDRRGSSTGPCPCERPRG